MDHRKTPRTSFYSCDVDAPAGIALRSRAPRSPSFSESGSGVSPGMWTWPTEAHPRDELTMPDETPLSGDWVPPPPPRGPPRQRASSLNASTSSLGSSGGASWLGAPAGPAVTVLVPTSSSRLRGGSRDSPDKAFPTPHSDFMELSTSSRGDSQDIRGVRSRDRRNSTRQGNNVDFLSAASDGNGKDDFRRGSLNGTLGGSVKVMMPLETREPGQAALARAGYSMPAALSGTPTYCADSTLTFDSTPRPPKPAAKLAHHHRRTSSHSSSDSSRHVRFANAPQSPRDEAGTPVGALRGSIPRAASGVSGTAANSASATARTKLSSPAQNLVSLLVQASAEREPVRLAASIIKPNVAPPVSGSGASLRRGDTPTTEPPSTALYHPHAAPIRSALRQSSYTSTSATRLTERPSFGARAAKWVPNASSLVRSPTQAAVARRSSRGMKSHESLQRCVRMVMAFAFVSLFVWIGVVITS